MYKECTLKPSKKYVNIDEEGYNSDQQPVNYSIKNVAQVVYNFVIWQWIVVKCGSGIKKG